MVREFLIVISVRLNLHHWYKRPSSAFSKKISDDPQFLYVFGRAPRFFLLKALEGLLYQ